MKRTVVGNDEFGYRASLTLPSGKDLTMFIVKENGEYKVLDSSKILPPGTFAL